MKRCPSGHTFDETAWACRKGNLILLDEIKAPDLEFGRYYYDIRRDIVVWEYPKGTLDLNPETDRLTPHQRNILVRGRSLALRMKKAGRN